MASKTQKVDTERKKSEKKKEGRKPTSLSRREGLGRELSRFGRLSGSRGFLGGEDRSGAVSRSKLIRVLVVVVDQEIKGVHGCHICSSKNLQMTPKRRTAK